MTGKADSSDPFAGYTPVKVVSVLEPETMPPVVEKPKKYRFGKKREGECVRTVKLTSLAAVSTVLIVLVAVVSFGFIYGRTLDDSEAPLGVYTNQVRQLSDLGRRVRAAVGVLPSPAVTNVVIHKRRTEEAVRTVGENAAEDVETEVEAKPSRHQVDPSLKRFFGGREGKRIR